MKINFDEPEYVMKGIYLYDLEFNKQKYFSRWEPIQVSRYLHCHISEVPKEPNTFTIITITGSNTIEIYEEKQQHEQTRFN